VVIHPRCVNTVKEFQRYSYKVDRLTEEVTSVIVDAWNHYIDAIRYALQPIMKRARRDYRKLL
jgi:phage terminase large subunit